MVLIILIIATLLIGFCQPIQAGINGKLKDIVGGSAFLSGAISNLVGAILMFIIFFTKAKGHVATFFPLNINKSNWFFYLGGGILSALIVSATIILPRKMSYTLFFITFLSGQVIMALLIDRFGLFGATATRITLRQIIGICLVLVGIFLVKK
jgi:transporter family-2 protein